MMIGRRAGGLHDIDVLAAHVLLNFDERLAIREWFDRAFSLLDPDRCADGFAQRLVRSAAKNLHAQLSKIRLMSAGWRRKAARTLSGPTLAGKAKLPREIAACGRSPYEASEGIG